MANQSLARAASTALHPHSQAFKLQRIAKEVRSLEEVNACLMRVVASLALALNAPQVEEVATMLSQRALRKLKSADPEAHAVYSRYHDFRGANASRLDLSEIRRILIARQEWATASSQQTFANFRVSARSQFAMAGMRALSMSKKYSPLYLSGPAGAGKTHLVQASITKFKKKWPEKSVGLFDPRDMPEILAAFRSAKVSTGPASLLDALYLEDLQCFEGLPGEREGERLFRSLVEMAEVVAITAACPAKELPFIKGEMEERLGRGLFVTI